SHTHTHAVFRGRPRAFSEDLAASVALLRDRFGVAEPTFAFPYGITDPALAGAARRAGVRCALTTQEQLAGPQEGPFTWGRFDVEEADSPATLAAKLDGWYSLARGAWLRLRGACARRGPRPDGPGANDVA